MDVTIPADIQRKLAELDTFIAQEIKPLEREHMQFFDHRREYARTEGSDEIQIRRVAGIMFGRQAKRA